MNIQSLKLVLVPAVAVLAMSDAAAQANAGSMANNAHASYNSTFNFDDGSPVARSSSVLVRNVNGVSYQLSTSGLEPDSAHTNWWIIFNNPENCAAVPCAEADLGNPAVNGSVAWASGEVSNAFGEADFAAHLVAGELPPGQVLFGPGLTNKNAEIHIVVRSHGPAAALIGAGMLEAALTTVAGGCGINACSDPQFTVHLP